MKQISLRLSEIQRIQIERLAKKLNIDKADVIRIAVSRMAEQEGITAPKRISRE